jgi:hypothetical protein
MKIMSKEFDANVVELTDEELASLEREVKFQEFINTRMPEIEEYESQVIEYIENNTDTHYADYYEEYKYLGYDDTYRYYMNLVERLGGFEQLFEITKELLDEYGFRQVTFSILVVVIQEELGG